MVCFTKGNPKIWPCNKVYTNLSTYNCKMMQNKKTNAKELKKNIKKNWQEYDHNQNAS